jgi:hypothetical protein
MNSQTDREMDIKTNGQTFKRTDGWTDRQTRERKTEREREREREREDPDILNQV